MKKEVLMFEARVIYALTNPKDDPLLYFSMPIKQKKNPGNYTTIYKKDKLDKAVHWDGYLTRLLEELKLTPEETKTAFLYFHVYENNSMYDKFDKEFKRVYDGIDILTMSDEELHERLISKNKPGFDYLSGVTYAYCYKKDTITSEIFNELYPIFTNNEIWKMDGTIKEEFEYNKILKLMQGHDVESFFTYSQGLFFDDSDMRIGETLGWKDFKQIDGFQEAFEKFLKDFKKQKRMEHLKKMENFKKEGIKSKLIIRRPREGFSYVIFVV